MGRLTFDLIFSRYDLERVLGLMYDDTRYAYYARILALRYCDAKYG